jgi:dihydropteroate synthase
MGIVNLTPDSFSGDGLVGDVDRAISHALQQFEAGSDILDIGAESTRPGAIPTSEREELRRLLPVLTEVTGWGVPVSVDTYKPTVMRAALEAGASMINDITGMIHEDALAIAAESDCAVCVMHMQGNPGTMQTTPAYCDVVSEVRLRWPKLLIDAGWRVFAMTALCLIQGSDLARHSNTIWHSSCIARNVFGRISVAGWCIEKSNARGNNR